MAQLAVPATPEAALVDDTFVIAGGFKRLESKVTV